jgi:hypothetical protein
MLKNLAIFMRHLQSYRNPGILYVLVPGCYLFLWIDIYPAILQHLNLDSLKVIIHVERRVKKEKF